MGIVWSLYIGGMTAAVRQGGSESAEELETCVKGVSASHMVQRFRQSHPRAPVPEG
jgi:hypothetical protein